MTPSLLSCRFLDYGEYRGNLYGTSIESVRDVLLSGKICVMDIDPNVAAAVTLPSSSRHHKLFLLYF